MLQTVTDTIHNRDGIAAAALLENGQVDRMLSVDAHNICLNGRRVLGLPDIGDQQLSVAAGFQRETVDLFRVGELRVGVNVEICRPELDVARRKNRVGST